MLTEGAMAAASCKKKRERTEEKSKKPNRKLGQLSSSVTLNRELVDWAAEVII